MNDYRMNHYVPVWYQKRFLIPTERQKTLYYLDLYPQTVRAPGRTYVRNSLLKWGVKDCFCLRDLYTTSAKEWISTEIEEKFFGAVDANSRPALDFFSDFSHPSIENEYFRRLILYISIQKLRTPKGLAALSAQLKGIDKNGVLFALQRLQQLYCACWAEGIWSIVDASASETKFLISDHPVTVYNEGCFPASRQCRGYGDPDIWQSGTHTIFPLSPDKLLIITNVSWVRYPYGNPTKNRPNPNPFRPTIFRWQSIQTGRSLSEQEVVQINYIIKARAYRYVAAPVKEWLYPEKVIGLTPWDAFGKSYLLMPDPRSVSFSTEVIIGYNDKTHDFFDSYGKKPWQKGYDDKARTEREWQTYRAFCGEFARRFGPERRGQSFEFGHLDSAVDSPDIHKSNLDSEKLYSKNRYRAR